MEHEVEFFGVVTRLKGHRGRGECRLSDGKEEYSIQSGEYVPGQILYVKGSITDIGRMTVVPKEIKEVEPQEEKKIFEKIEQSAIEKVSLKDAAPICNDEVAQKLKGRIEEVARKLLAASKLGRFILLRFHHDADGIGGAIALTEFLRCRTQQQNSAIYSARDAVRDLGVLHNEARPIVILLDFGSSKESGEGIQLLSAAGIEVIIIDHHPPDKEHLKAADIVLSPWQVLEEERASRYVAGYLASEIANICGVDAAKLAKSSCAGDKSEILEISDEDKKRALVLDYLAANASYGNNLEFYKSALQKEDLFRSLYQQADDKITSAANTLLGGAKPKEVNGIQVYVFDLDRVVIPKEFPNRSKVATRLFETLSKEEGAVLVLGYGERTVIMRAGSGAIEKGADLAKLCSRIREDMKDFVPGGGGHSRAAALWVKEGYAKTAIEALISMLGN